MKLHFDIIFFADTAREIKESREIACVLLQLNFQLGSRGYLTELKDISETGWRWEWCDPGYHGNASPDDGSTHIFFSSTLEREEIYVVLVV